MRENNASEGTMRKQSTVLDGVSWLFGLAVAAIGIINMFWGNDPGFGIFLFLLSFVYFPPANTLWEKWTGIAIPRVVKIILAVFILWVALGVGELFDKIDLMKQSF